MLLYSFILNTTFSVPDHYFELVFRNLTSQSLKVSEDRLVLVYFQTHNAFGKKFSFFKKKKKKLIAFCFLKVHYTLFYKQHFFSTQPLFCLIFSKIELQMLLRCCLIHKSIIVLRHILCLVYSCPPVGLGLFISHLFHFQPHVQCDYSYNLV